LIDLDAGRLEIHRDPSDAGYGNIRIPRPGEAFAPAAFPDLGLTLRDLLG
jgi:Uma2 family endonuclease